MDDIKDIVRKNILGQEYKIKQIEIDLELLLAKNFDYLKESDPDAYAYQIACQKNDVECLKLLIERRNIEINFIKVKNNL